MHERQPRVSFTRPVYVAAEAWSRPKRLLAANVSDGGMFVRTDQELAPGTKLSVSLEAKGKVFPFAEAEVVWCADAETWTKKGRLPGMGVRFVRFLHPRSEKLIDHLLHRGAAQLPPEVANQVVGGAESLSSPLPEPMPMNPQPSLPPQDFASVPLNDLSAPEAEAPDAAEPAWAAKEEESAPPAKKAKKQPLDVDLEPPERALTSALDESDYGARIATAVGLLTVLAVVGGGMLFLIHRNSDRLAAAAGNPIATSTTAVTPNPDPVTPSPVEVAAPAPLTPSPVEAAVAAPAPAAPAEVEAPAPKPAAAPRPVEARESSHSLKVGSGAITAVSWRASSGTIDVTLGLATGSRVDRVFALSNPARVVVDVSGPSPKGSFKQPVKDPGFEMVRTGARDGGTRLVLDMKAPIASVEEIRGGVRIHLK